jgi:Cu/Ag efflux protein CusF
MKSMPLCNFGLIMMGLVLSSPVTGQDNSADSIAKGEVTKVDLTAGKITIKHGPIASMKMNAREAFDDFKVNEPNPAQFAGTRRQDQLHCETGRRAAYDHGG